MWDRWVDDFLLINVGVLLGGVSRNTDRRYLYEYVESIVMDEITLVVTHSCGFSSVGLDCVGHMPSDNKSHRVHKTVFLIRYAMWAES